VTDLVTAPAGALTLLSELERQGKITATALVIDDPDFPWEQWVALGSFFGETKSRLSFYLGDWLIFGEGMYRDRYSQAVDATGLNYETLTNYASVCRNVARSRRRDPTAAAAAGRYPLSFGHHAEVSKLEPPAQTEWLERAEFDRLTRSALRSKMDEVGLVRHRHVQPAAQLPLAPKPIVDAASSLTVIRDALEKIHHGEGDAVDLPRVLRAVDRSTETLKIAAQIPTLLDAVQRLLDDADPIGSGHTYAVASEIIDELRALVANEGGSE
jgi:hypothetical protein